MIKQYLIIGSSAAGVGCALRLRMLDPHADITMLSAEADLPYNKCFLADVLLGEKELDATILCTKQLLVEKRITFLPSTRVIAIEPHERYVIAADGSRFLYDAACIATGRSPRVLPLFTDHNFSNLFTFYTKNDLVTIFNYIQTRDAQRALIIGAGLTGLEAADGLRARGLQVTVIEAAAHLLPTLVNETGAAVIKGHAEKAGVTVYTGEKIVEYTALDKRITAVHTASGGSHAADLVICAIGATPNSSFLSPFLLHENGYLRIDVQMQTAMPTIFAAGDCCMVYDRLSQQLVPNALWSDAMQQGMHAAYGMCGIAKPYPGAVMIASSSFFGLKVAIAGPSIPRGGERIEEQHVASGYRRFIYNGDTLRGFMLIGNTSELSHYRRMLLSI